MYDRRLDSFVKVVELGSFSKAGGSLFISANAVIKKINALERDLGVQLLVRSKRGVRPTAAGTVIYRGALDIIAESNALVERARNLAGSSSGTVRLASSLMFSSGRIGDLWSKLAKEHPRVSFEIVPIASSQTPFFERVGKDFDVVLTVEPIPDLPGLERCESRVLLRSPACIAVPADHRLATKNRLSMSDLEGERLYLTARGFTPEIERIRDWLCAHDMHMDIMDCIPYDIGAFNAAAREHALVFHCVELGSVHPSYINVPLEEDFSFPLCLVYSSTCSDTVREFVEAILQQASNDFAPSNR